MKKYHKSLFLFRRDLRLHDNSGLIAAVKQSKLVVPCFIFDPRQIEHHQYQSKPALRFMLASLFDLDQQLQEHQSRLSCYYAKPEEAINQLIASEQIDAVFLNHDYTPFSRERDQAIKNVCEKNNIGFHPYHDHLLIGLDEAQKKTKHRTRFSPRSSKMPQNKKYRFLKRLLPLHFISLPK